MLKQFEDMILNTFIQKMNQHGIQVDAETVKRAVANSPQVVQKVEEILLSNSSDRFNKIMDLIKQTANAGGSTDSNTDTTKK